MLKTIFATLDKHCRVMMLARDHRVGVFNFGTDRVRVLEKISGSGSGTDRVRVIALHFYHSGIIGYRKSSSGTFWLHP